MRKLEPIEKIRKRFKKEWLLIAVPKTRGNNYQPSTTGRLLAHSPRRDKIYEVMLRTRRPALITFSEDGLPAGFAAAF